MNKKISSNMTASDKPVVNYVLQDIGMILFLLGLFTAVVLLTYLEVDSRLEYAVMLFSSFFSVVIAAYRYRNISLAMAGFETIVYMGFKLYMSLFQSRPIEGSDFFWLLFPLYETGAMNLYIYRAAKIEEENGVLRARIEDLLLLDPITGLNNIKSMYMDLKTQTSIAQRAGCAFSLMIVSIKYYEELKKIMGQQKMNELTAAMGLKLSKLLRTGDRIYSIDSKGTFALALISDAEGAEIVKKRIKDMINTTEILPGDLTSQPFKLELRIGYLEYKHEIYQEDFLRFKKHVENELQYDV
jgi:GGDEF domain-containing protein